jgi:hypothetical protein
MDIDSLCPGGTTALVCSPDQNVCGPRLWEFDKRVSTPYQIRLWSWVVLFRVRVGESLHGVVLRSCSD